MDMFTIHLNENREYVIVPNGDVTEEDAFHIMRRMVFDFEQRRLADQIVGVKDRQSSDTADRIRKRLSDRKQES